MAQLQPPPSVETRYGCLPQGEDWEALVAEDRPVLFKGGASDWPLVLAGLSSDREAFEHCRSFYSGREVTVYRAQPIEGGRFFYNSAMNGFNYTAAREDFGAVGEELLGLAKNGSGEAIYIGSTDLGSFFPGFSGANSLDLAAVHPSLAQGVLQTIWLGNRTTASCHYDFSNNIAVCAVGARRFTLFPPDQANNLYPGPLEPTPGGQVVSMVDFRDPDLEAFPRFGEAWKHAQVAEMEPGDVLVYPAMWWHHVEALGGFNVLVNYWWNAVPDFMDSPQVTLIHAMLSLRDRPASEKAAWKAIFDHYVFGDAEQARAHLPEHIHGPLAPMSAPLARHLRALVTRKLQR
jgi:hypothetical protein